MAKDLIEKDLGYWQAQIETARKFRERFGKSKRWETLKKYHRNEWGDNVLDYDEDESLYTGVLPYNILHINLRSTIPKLYYKDPYVMVRPVTDQFSVPCRMRETALNWVIHKNGTKQTMREIAEYTWMFGRGPGLVGFDVPPPQSMDEILAGNTVRGNEVKHEFNLYKKENLPWFVPVHPENHLVPFGVRHITDTPWAAHGVLRDLDDLRNDKRYNTKDIDGTHLPIGHVATDYSDASGSSEAVTNLVYFWEIHDFRSGQVMALIEGYGEWLRKPEKDESQVDGVPFVSCVFNPDTDYYWCTSDALYLEPQLLEGNEVRTQLQAHRRIDTIHWLMEEGMIDEPQLKKVLDGSNVGGVGTYKQIGGGDIRTKIMEFRSGIPPELYGYILQINSDGRDTTGLGPNQGANFERKSHTTATESAIVQRGFETRLDDKQDAISDTLLMAVQKMDMFMAKHWQDDMTVKVMGVDGRAYWVRYSAKDLEGQYEIEIDPRSMVKQDPQEKKMELMQTIQTMQNNPRVNINYLMRLLLREYSYIDVLEALPEAPAGPQNADEFINSQNELRQTMAQSGQAPPAIGG